MLNCSVIFLTFNRPELTLRTFKRIRAVMPRRLLLVCDGPRAGNADDVNGVEGTQSIVCEGTDWPCSLKVNISPLNLGCRKRVATGLDWAFSIVADAIVIEDDCLADVSFFRFCVKLLRQYRLEDAAMHISGTNFAAGLVRHRSDYWITFHASVWGWATWSRSWEKYDYLLESWDHSSECVANSFASNWEREYWMSDWRRRKNSIDLETTWDIMWSYAVRAHGGLCFVPENNLVENIGLDVQATHTRGGTAHLRRKVEPLQFPLRHPRKLGRARIHDEIITRGYARGSVTVWETVISTVSCSRKALASVVKSRMGRTSRRSGERGKFMEEA